ncbi:MAG: hypothetical protein DMF56_21810 [Acidobacteria bacterium]|nr:MAG: hypothetical protein DMF56_21810 [Acidobacteriota bacterium]
MAGDPPAAVPFSTVFAMTGGFVSFYSDSTPFTLPGGQVLPASSSSGDLGAIVLTIWGADFGQLNKGLAPELGRPVAILYRGLDKNAVSKALEGEVGKMPKRALVQSWKDGGGQGTEPDQATLKQLHLARILAGSGSVFVNGGTPLGEAVTALSGSDTNAEFVLHSYEVDAAGNAVFVPPSSLIVAVGGGHV